MDANSKAVKSTKEVLTTAASLAASAMLARSLVNEFLPTEARYYLSLAANALRARFSTEHAVVIEEMEGWSGNLVYTAVETYLATKITTSTTRVRVSNRRGNAKTNIAVSLEQGGEMTDRFEGIEFKWRLLSRGNNIVDQPDKIKLYELKFHRMYKGVVFDTYLPYILERARAIETEAKKLKMYLNEQDGWRPMSLHHPATFDTLAMDPDIKRTVMDDLATFAERKDYYKNIGRAWKRGYLIYGPPGTGKSSLVAAMANYLKFNIYDLELTEMTGNSMMKRLLIGMANKSMLVVEDIDCSITGGGNDERMTLSGLLNLVDGLWSSCGEERIVVFTTNYKNRLDPALLRPGRMDVHIHMGYCGPSAVRTLVSNYHGVDSHPLLGKIDEAIGEAKVTPAEVAEELTRSGDTDTALTGLVEFLHAKRERSAEAEDTMDEGCEYTSNVSSAGKHYCNGDSFEGRLSRTKSIGNGPATVFRGRGGRMSSFCGRGGHLQSFRGGGGRLQASRGRGNGSTRTFVTVYRGRRVKLYAI